VSAFIAAVQDQDLLPATGRFQNFEVTLAQPFAMRFDPPDVAVLGQEVAAVERDRTVELAGGGGGLTGGSTVVSLNQNLAQGAAAATITHKMHRRLQAQLQRL